MMAPETLIRNYSNSCVNTYKEQEIMMSSPEKCILHLYDAAIQGCAMSQEDRAGKALAMLIDGLDYQAGGDIAKRLFELYEYCLRLIHRHEFESPIRILKGIREAWQKALTAELAA